MIFFESVPSDFHEFKRSNFSQRKDDMVIRDANASANARLVVTHRLMQHDYLGQNVISRGLDLKSNVDRTVESHHAHVATCLGEKITMMPEICC